MRWCRPGRRLRPAILRLRIVREILSGALDGLLFALAGFGLGFALFFVLWVLGACGGGDVKLFAALGAWVGPALAVGVLAGTVVVLAAAVAARAVWTLLTRGLQPFA